MGLQIGDIVRHKETDQEGKVVDSEGGKITVQLNEDIALSCAISQLDLVQATTDPNALSLPVIISIINADGENIKLGENGYLGRLESGRITVNVVVVPNLPYSDIYGISVDGKKAVESKKDWMPPEDESDSKVYKMRVMIQKDEGEACPHTHYPSNHFKLLRIFADGAVEVWEIVIVSQDGQFFLTLQCTYELQRYKNDQGSPFLCPYFDKKWPEMNNFIAQAFAESFIPSVPGVYNRLPSIEEQQLEIEPDPKSFQPNEGQVIWFNLATGFGCAITDKGVARIHWTQAPQREGGLRYLAADELIAYEKLRWPKRSLGKHPTSFTRELVEISLL